MEAIIKRNQIILDEFNKYLIEEKLSKKTIKKHVGNVEFYINEFLVYSVEVSFLEGWQHIDNFLGDWFIRKAMWSSPSSVKEYISSLKKFYKFIFESNKISKSDYKLFLDIIKDCKEEWIQGAEL